MEQTFHILVKRAATYSARGAFGKAFECYELAIDQAGAQVVPWDVLAQAARSAAALHQDRHAVRYYRQAIHQAPVEERSSLEAELGRLFQSMGNWGEASVCFRSVLERGLCPESRGDALYWLGESLLHVPGEGDSTEHLNVLDEALAASRTEVMDWEVHNTKGYALVSRGRPLDALNEFSLALDEEDALIDIPGNIYNNLASCYERLGDEEQALDYYERAFSHHRSPPDTRAWAKMKMGSLILPMDALEAREHLLGAKALFQQARDSREVCDSAVSDYLAEVESDIRRVDRQIKSAEAAASIVQFDIDALRSRIDATASGADAASGLSRLLDDVVVMNKLRTVDPSAAVTKARKVLEFVVTQLFVERFDCAEQHLPGLAKMVSKLRKETGVLPERVVSHVYTVINMGNIGAHPQQGEVAEVSAFDAKIIGLHAAAIVEWYVTSGVTS